MMRYLALIAALAVWPGAKQALPPIELVREAIDQSPALEAARADVERAKATAKRLSVGTYEITAQGGGGRRRVDNALNPDDRFTEWQASVSRAMRLPGKRATDQNLGDLEVAIAQAGLDVARREAQMTFAQLWADWRRAESAAALAKRTAAQAQTLADANAQGVKAGGARRVDADQLAAWAGFYSVDAISAAVQASNARAALAAAFPALALPDVPPVLGWDEARVASLLTTQAPQSPAARSAQLVAQRADAAAKRARQDRIPDPTFGFQLSNEFGGQEKSFLATVSIPLSGRARAATTREAAAQSARAAAQLRAADLEAERRVLTARRAASAAVSNVKQAEAAQALIESALDRLEQGRAVGGVTLPELMTARRNLYDTQQALITSRITSEQSLMELAILLDAFLK